MKQSNANFNTNLKDDAENCDPEARTVNAIKESRWSVGTLCGAAEMLLPAREDQHVIYQLMSYRALCLRENDSGRANRFEKANGAVTLVPSGNVPAIWLLEPATFITFNLDDSFIVSIREELGLERTISSVFRSGMKSPSITALIQLIADEHRSGNPSGALYSDSLAYALAVKFLLADVNRRVSTQPVVSVLPEHILARVKARIEADLGEPLTLIDLARESGYSRAHFVRLFQASLGKTPHQYILTQRIHRALRMLRESHDTLAEIALKCGFSSQAHMNVVFRQVLRTTPGTVRRG